MPHLKPNRAYLPPDIQQADLRSGLSLTSNVTIEGIPPCSVFIHPYVNPKSRSTTSKVIVIFFLYEMAPPRVYHTIMARSHFPPTLERFPEDQRRLTKIYRNRIMPQVVQDMALLSQLHGVRVSHKYNTAKDRMQRNHTLVKDD